VQHHFRENVQSLAVLKPVHTLKITACPTQLSSSQQTLALKNFLLLAHALNNGFFAVSLPSHRRTFYADMNLILNCEVIKTESSDLW